jgi:hypothetical protein
LYGGNPVASVERCKFHSIFSTMQGLSNKPKSVKIGGLEPEF